MKKYLTNSALLTRIIDLEKKVKYLTECLEREGLHRVPVKNITVPTNDGKLRREYPDE